MCSFSTSTSRELRLADAADAGRDRQARRRGDDHRALHHVAELADVARPRVALQRGEVVLVDRIDPLAEGSRTLDETPDEQGDVLTRAQGHLDGDHVSR
jgi:hypothetical protein